MDASRLVWKVGLALLVACGGDPAPPPPDPSGIVIVWPGTGPRAVLAYAPVKGTTSELVLVLASEVTASGQGGPLPTLEVRSSLAVEDVRPDRTARLRLTVREVVATAHPASTMSADAMTEHMQLLAGTSLVGTLQPDGVITDLHPETPARLPPGLDAQVQQVTQAFQQFALALPHTAVGDGAMWQLTRHLEQGGLKLRSVTSVALGAREGATIPYTIVSTLSGADQVVEMSGTRIAVSQIGGVARATGAVDLSKVALVGTASFSLGSDMRIGDDTDHMVMRVETTLR